MKLKVKPIGQSRMTLKRQSTFRIRQEEISSTGKEINPERLKMSL